MIWGYPIFLETPIYWKQGQPQKYLKEMMRFPQFSHKEETCRFFGHEQFAAMVAKGEGYTLQKPNIDTKKIHKMPILKGVTFSKPSFWVSIS